MSLEVVVKRVTIIGLLHILGACNLPIQKSVSNEFTLDDRIKSSKLVYYLSHYNHSIVCESFEGQQTTRYGAELQLDTLVVKQFEADSVEIFLRPVFYRDKPMHHCYIEIDSAYYSDALIGYSYTRAHRLPMQTIQGTARIRSIPRPEIVAEARENKALIRFILEHKMTVNPEFIELLEEYNIVDFE